MNVLIIEDEAPAFRRLQKILDEIDPELEILEVIDSVEDSVKWLRNHSSPDLIFMDIQLSDGISFEIFDAIDISSPVIFTTAFDEYMLKAFKVNSIDYLLKPIKKEDLAQSIEKYRSLKTVFSGNASMNDLIKQIRLDDRKFKSRFLVKQGDKLLSIQTDDIKYFQTKNGVVYLATTEKKYLLDFTLDDLIKQLDPEKFYRANRQFVVGYNAIKAIHRYHKGKLLVELQIPTDEQIIVSSEKATDFKQWLD
ncbi:MAG: LytTR family DNA-binding domain-containing protein [bacterium]|nr:LytTR family DNA-binding domain-containing protein [bacterium]